MGHFGSTLAHLHDSGCTLKIFQKIFTMKGTKKHMKFILVVFVKKSLFRVFSDTWHKARIHKNLSVTEKKFFGENILSKMVKNLSAVAPKTDFFWIFFGEWFNGFIVLLNSNNISNFMLGHNHLKLNCLCYCCCCLIFVYRFLIIYVFIVFSIVCFFFLVI